MKKTRKILSLVMAVLMLVSCVSVASVQAATTISYAPNPKVEYGYSSGVTTGTIRYISQIRGSTYFNSNYWGNWESQAGIECGTASISMALSYVGVNKTPKAILDAHSGTTYFTGWGPTTSNPSVANGMNNYINGNGKYSPPIVHFTTGYASGSHYVILIGKVSSSSYLVLDPASNNTWTLSTSDAKYKSINQVFQYYNPNNSSPSGSHTHIYDVHYEADHPHRDYKKCSCGDWYYTGTTHDTYNWHYEGDHPHRAYKTCWCGDWHYTGETVYVSSCSTCKHSHSYSSKVTKQATCTSTGIKTFTCSCGKSYTESIAKTSHNSNTKIPAVAPTCRETGLTEGKKCSVCGTITVAQQTVAVKSHKDDNGDYKCDYGCGYEFEKPEVDTPTTDCSCSCHKSGISKFFFNIILFFQKLFGTNQECKCGVAHY